MPIQDSLILAIAGRLRLVCFGLSVGGESGHLKAKRIPSVKLKLTMLRTIVLPVRWNRQEKLWKQLNSMTLRLGPMNSQRICTIIATW
jgi:hypothetical protein